MGFTPQCCDVRWNPPNAAQSGANGSTAAQAGKAATSSPKSGAVADTAKSDRRLAQTGVNAEATLGLMAVMAVAGAGCVLVKARGKHINRWQPRHCGAPPRPQSPDSSPSRSGPRRGAVVFRYDR